MHLLRRQITYFTTDTSTLSLSLLDYIRPTRSLSLSSDTSGVSKCQLCSVMEEGIKTFQHFFGKVDAG